MIERETGAFVGDLAFHWVSEEHRTGEIGYVVAPAHKGKGYAVEGSRALLDWAFRDGGFHRMIGRIEPRNVASARVLEKLGMRHEALFVENEWIKGEWQSESVYAILEREWPR
jgi:RimJ/RimL family protein N-acetyltransferase